jgi:hypothetical protein
MLYGVAALLLCCASFGGEALQMRTLFKGNFSGLQEPSQVVITNQAGWEALWQRHEVKVSPKTSPPEVDFSKEAVVVAALGQKKSGGYAIEIAEVRQTPEGAEAIVKTRSPKAGTLTIQALTAPTHIVAVPITTGKFVFKTE